VRAAARLHIVQNYVALSRQKDQIPAIAQCKSGVFFSLFAVSFLFLNQSFNSNFFVRKISSPFLFCSIFGGKKLFCVGIWNQKKQNYYFLRQKS
jgi:hypothetical protein